MENTFMRRSCRSNQSTAGQHGQSNIARKIRILDIYVARAIINIKINPLKIRIDFVSSVIKTIL
jgi:hypothetical protein